MLPKPIHHTFGPLATPEQVKQASLLLCQPWRWREGGDRENLRLALQRMFDRPTFLFGSGREALLAGLRSLKLRPEDEVIVQGFTCCVVPNAIMAAGGKPVYTDIDPETLNFDLDAVEQAISARTRAIICQHTFGIPVDTKRLRALCNVHQLALIEDLAHSIPSNDTQERIGKYADMLVLSFGRDKAVSGVTGGAVLSQHDMLIRDLEQQEHKAAPLPYRQIGCYLSYPVFYSIAKALWPMRLGKPFLKALQILRALIPVLQTEEKTGRMQAALHGMPNAMASLALEQGRRLSAINAHRRKLSEHYAAVASASHWNVPLEAKEAEALQKFPLLLPEADSIRAALKQHEIYLDDGWTGAVINPRNVDQQAMKYRKHSCPRAEKLATEILCLPTHPTMTMKQADELIKTLQTIIDNE